MKKKTKNAAKRAAKKHPKLFIALTVILVIVIIAVVIVFAVRPDFAHKLELNDHKWSGWTEVPATCGKDGIQTRGCRWCDEVETEVIPATGKHTWGDWKTEQEATCNEDGKKERTCSNCHIKDEDTISATGEHAWGEWKTVKEATCGDDGSQSRVCSVCKEKQSEVISATGNHAWGEWKTVEEAVCGKDGIRERTCEVCHKTEEESISALGGHSWGEWTTVKQATCGEDGKKERECAVCHIKEEETITATGEHKLGADGVCTVCGYGENSSTPGTLEEVAKSELSIHFLELGNKYTGDCTLIKYGNTEVLIDAGSRNDSAVTIKKYVDKYCTDGVLEYVIATHAHQDHIAGFVGNASGSTRTGILYQYKVGTLIQFAGTNSSTKIYKDYCTAVEYAKAEPRGTTVYTAKQCWYETDGAKKQYFLDDENKVSLNILYQRYYDEKTSDENDYSVCVLLTQVTANKTYNYLFTGDLEEKGESSLVDSNNLPEVELFKGGHHGSYTATTAKLLKVIKPKNVAVCCCCGTTEYTSNIQNTFPAQAFLDRVAKYTENIYCTTLITDYSAGKYTSMNGNIVFYTLNGKLKLYCSNNDIILKDTDWFKANRVWNT